MKKNPKEAVQAAELLMDINKKKPGEFKHLVPEEPSIASG